MQLRAGWRMWFCFSIYPVTSKHKISLKYFSLESFQDQQEKISLQKTSVLVYSNTSCALQVSTHCWVAFFVRTETGDYVLYLVGRWLSCSSCDLYRRLHQYRSHRVSYGGSAPNFVVPRKTYFKHIKNKSILPLKMYFIPPTSKPGYGRARDTNASVAKLRDHDCNSRGWFLFRVNAAFVTSVFLKMFLVSSQNDDSRKLAILFGTR